MKCSYKPCNNLPGDRPALDGCCSVTHKVRRDRAALAKKESKPAPVKVALKPAKCANPACSKTPAGRKRIYCDKACRTSHYKKMHDDRQSKLIKKANKNRPKCAARRCKNQLPPIVEGGPRQQWGMKFCSKECRISGLKSD